MCCAVIVAAAGYLFRAEIHNAVREHMDWIDNQTNWVDVHTDQQQPSDDMAEL